MTQNTQHTSVGGDVFLHPDAIRLQQAARALLGWSQKDLADVTGVSLSTLNRMERGGGRPSFFTLQAISSALMAAGVEAFRQQDGSIGVKISAEGLANSKEYPTQPDGSKLIKIYPHADDY